MEDSHTRPFIGDPREMKLLDIYEGLDPRYLIIHVQRWWGEQVWRGSLGEGWYQPKNGRRAKRVRIQMFLDKCAFDFRMHQRELCELLPELPA